MQQPPAPASIRANAAWAGLAASGIQGATVIANVLVALILGASAFGTYSFLQGTLNSWGQVAQASSGLLAARYLAAWRQTDPRRASQILGLCTVVCLGLGGALGIALYASGATGLLGSSDAAVPANGFAMTALAVPFLAMTIFQAGVFAGLEQFRRQAILAFCQTLFFIVLPAFGARFAGAVGAVGGLLTALLVRAVSNEIAIRGAARRVGIAPALRGSRALLRTFADFAVPATATGITTAGGLWLATLLLFREDGGSFQMGLFGTALIFRALVLFGPAQLASVVVPRLARSHAGGDAVQFRRVILRTTAAITAVALALAGGLAVLAPWLVQMFGSEFSAAVPIVRIVLLASVVEAIASGFYQALPGQARMWRSFTVVALPRDAALVLLAVWLIPQLQGVGLAVAMLVSQLIGLGGVLWATRDNPRAAAAVSS